MNQKLSKQRAESLNVTRRESPVQSSHALLIESPEGFYARGLDSKTTLNVCLVLISQ